MTQRVIKEINNGGLSFSLFLTPTGHAYTMSQPFPGLIPKTLWFETIQSSLTVG